MRLVTGLVTASATPVHVGAEIVSTFLGEAKELNCSALKVISSVIAPATVSHAGS